MVGNILQYYNLFLFLSFVLQKKKGRAVYGLDLMIGASDLQPYLLEVNFNSDTSKICKWAPSFWNDAMATLFLLQEEEEEKEKKKYCAADLNVTKLH